MIFNMTGGANPLNFKVVGNPKPANPKENTIWIDTDIPIPFYVMCPPVPGEVPYVEEGFVWIVTGNSFAAAFNALKKNALVVCPIAAYQYIGGIWVQKEAQIYQGGRWANWFAPSDFVRSGLLNPDVSLTGKLRATQSFAVTQETGYVRVRSTSNVSGGIASDTAYDVSGFTKLTLKCKAVTLATGSDVAALCVGLTNTLNADVADVQKFFVAKTTTGSTGEYTLVCDISTVTGSYYPAIAFNVGSGAYPDLYIYDFYLS